ncbi:DNA-binding protein [Pseudoscardovia radai]|uniref:DNA-binding protein n=1 Tax=Pseudoscardovia radai TaxID=987066 RepID=A0A261F0N9_9BIFI|nr:helix-hairpin-helix domain-containing protein [Pseudoscardovia radai]OZG52694.1 DNA-binding protein [Pseudoscardovia radai]
MDPADGAGLHDGGAECAVATPGERLALVHGLEPWCDDTAEAVVPDSIASVSAVSASADDPKVPEIGERRKRSESGEIGERGESGGSGGSSENGERGGSGEFWDDEDGEMYENDEYDEKSGTRGLGLGSGSRPMLAMLSGVDPHDADTSVHTAPQSGAAARWVISQRACMAIILVLVVALAASLALVVRQGSTILQVAEGSVAAAPGTQSGTRSSARSDTGAGSAHSLESHTMAESGGAAESSASPAPGAASSGTPDAVAPGAASSGTPDAVAPGSAAPTDTGGAPGAASPGDAGKVNLNTATREELQTIKGVGPATAQKILDYRAAHGRFTSVDELLKIDGIGAKTLEKIRPEVTI